MKPILVLGGGIAGVTSALELAEAGKQVILVEKSAYLGGNVLRMHNYFPKLCPPACGMEINFRRIRSNPRIKVMTHSELVDISGEKGSFVATVKREKQFVNDFCTSCGECLEVCPVERPDAFNYNFGMTKAVFRPLPLSYPQKFTIDPAACLGASCSKCVEVCAYDAIDLNSIEEIIKLDVHSVIIATGWNANNADSIAGLNYSKSPDIVTNVEFERLLSVSGPNKGVLLRPSDGEVPKSLAFVQCAGSRDRNYLPYCSAVCCSASLKHALNITERLPDAKVSVFYIDLRVTGRNEDFLKRVEATERIHLVKGKVAKVEVDTESDKLIVIAEDIASGRKVRELFDMVVLATGIIPANGVAGMQKNPDGFYSAQQEEGIIVSACAKKPMDVSASVKDATAAALKAMKI